MFCLESIENVKNRLRYHERKLAMLKLYKDSLERRLAATIASIETLEEQIKRDE